MNNSYLAHYGVKGMKWHIRKKQDELYEKQLALKQRKEEQRAVYKTEEFKKMSSSARKQQRLDDKESNVEFETDIEERKEELEALTNELVDLYKEINLQKINTKRSMDRAALIIKKFKIKKAAII